MEASSTSVSPEAPHPPGLQSLTCQGGANSRAGGSSASITRTRVWCGRLACGGKALPCTGARTSPHAITVTAVPQKHRHPATSHRGQQRDKLSQRHPLSRHSVAAGGEQPRRRRPTRRGKRETSKGWARVVPFSRGRASTQLGARGDVPWPKSRRGSVVELRRCRTRDPSPRGNQAKMP